MKIETFSKLPRKLQHAYLAKLRRNHGDFWSVELRQIYSECYGVQIGIGSYGCFDTQAFPRGTVIGSYCSIAQGVWAFNGNHPLNAPSLHPLFYNTTLGCDVEDIPRRNLVIGHGVWIGRNALILPGCSKIGNGAVVGAGAVVTHEVPPYAVVGGCPAKVLKYRFDEVKQRAVEATKWWEWDISELRAHAKDFGQMATFLEYAKTRPSSVSGEDA